MQAKVDCGDEFTPSPYISTVAPTPVPIPAAPNGQCSSSLGTFDSQGNCIPWVVSDQLPSNCPSGFTTDGDGSCLRISPSPAPTTPVCAFGFY